MSDGFPTTEPGKQSCRKLAAEQKKPDQHHVSRAVGSGTCLWAQLDVGCTCMGELWVCSGDGWGGGHSTALGQGVSGPSLAAAGEEITTDVQFQGLGVSCSQLTQGLMGPSSH